MKAFHTILFAFCLLVFSPAQAEQESPFKGGMNYTTLSKRPNQPANADQGKLKQSARETAPLRATPEKEAGAEETPASKVWKKYKSLAAGEAEEETEAASAPKGSALPGDPNDAQASAESTQAPSPTGIAAIIQKYEKNKQRQSQMQTIKVHQPTPPAKPSVESPKTE